MKFEEPKYYFLEENFNLEMIADIKSATKFWKSTLIKDRVKEEVLETFLFLNLSEFTRINDLKVLFRSPDGMYGTEDICAVDRFGRIHLFEAKKGKITEINIKQLNWYLDNNIFKDPMNFIDQRMKWAGSPDKEAFIPFNKEDLALYLAGMFANITTSTEGIKLIKKEWEKNQPDYIKEAFGRFTINKNNYNRKLGKRKNEVLIRTIISRFKLNYDYEKIIQLASDLYPRMIFLPKEPTFDYLTEHPVVGWLIGPEIRDNEINKLKDVRKSGKDIRVILIDMRRLNRQSKWILKIQNEDYKKRELLEQKVLDERQKFEAGHRTLKLKFQLYKEVSASKSKETGGEILENPRAIISGKGMAEKFITV